jgi:metallo-beta-lactamase family protein
MKVRFLGPIDRVTGSCSWLRDDALGFEAVVDCGLMQGEAGDSDWNAGKFPFDPRKLTHVFLTHAHIDHCGLIPALYRLGYAGTVYCTTETAELAKLVLLDAVKHGAPYSREHVEAIRFYEPPLDKARNLFAPVHREVFLKWYRTGHIYGAVSMALYVGPPVRGAQKTIVFSGDLGGIEDNAEQLTLNRARETPFAVDYAVIESTYGDRMRSPEEDDREARLARLTAELQRAADGGMLILPCFAIDRTQQILLDLHEVLRRDAIGERSLTGVHLKLHAKLAAQVNAIYARAATRKFTSGGNKTRPWWLGKGLFQQLGLDPHDATHERAVEAWVRLCLGQPTSKRDDELLQTCVRGGQRRLTISTRREAEPLEQGTVLVTGGGMCDGGMVHGYLAAHLHRPEVTIGFTGYLSGGTLGAQLFSLTELPDVDRARLPGSIRLTTRPDAAVDYPVID